MISKVSEIDLKIKALQDKKKKLEEKQLIQLAQLIKKSGAYSFSAEILLGVIIDAVKTFKENQESVKRWQEVGREFLEAEKEKNFHRSRKDNANENGEGEGNKNKKTKDSFRK